MESSVPGAKHTLIFYAHYDGQPVDKTQWANDPWEPTLRDEKLEDGGKPDLIGFSSLRGAGRVEDLCALGGDDKTPIQALLTSLDALQAAHLSPKVNLKFFFEGEEEAGSEHLPAAIAKYADLVRADAWILCDGPVLRRDECRFSLARAVKLASNDHLRSDSTTSQRPLRQLGAEPCHTHGGVAGLHARPGCAYSASQTSTMMCARFQIRASRHRRDASGRHALRQRTRTCMDEGEPEPLPCGSWHPH